MKISKKSYLNLKIVNTILDIKNHIAKENRYKIKLIEYPKKTSLKFKDSKKTLDKKILHNKLDESLEETKSNATVSKKHLENDLMETKQNNNKEISHNKLDESLEEIKSTATVSKKHLENDLMETKQNNNLEAFKKLEEKVLECTACDLCQSRNNVVFGMGNSSTDVMFIGEGPGRDEDIHGIPFVGKAGKLLTIMLKAIEIDRKDIYITNIVKCRPPNNRNPLESEIKACTPYLTKQIQLIKPKIIVTLGNFASKFILKTNMGIKSIRGKIENLDDILILAIYHPSYLLRNPINKIDTWKDLQLLQNTIHKLNKK